MNPVLLITITFTLALVHGYNKNPCEKNNDNNAYNNFAKKHILQDKNLDRKSIPAWEKYIKDNKLCGRPKQSFFEPGSHVEQICQGQGRHKEGHLCISTNKLPFYYVEVDNNCKVKMLDPKTDYVIVACDVIVNQCLPVHFEKNNGQGPDMSAVCQKVNAA